MHFQPGALGLELECVVCGGVEDEKFDVEETAVALMSAHKTTTLPFTCLVITLRFPRKPISR